MRKYENFCNALSNMKDIYNYEEPYDNVVITGLVGLYEICFEQSWKMMKEILEIHGYAEGATGSPKIILKTAYKAGMIRDEAVQFAKASSAIAVTLYPFILSGIFISFLYEPIYLVILTVLSENKSL